LEVVGEKMHSIVHFPSLEFSTFFHGEGGGGLSFHCLYPCSSVLLIFSQNQKKKNYVLVLFIFIYVLKQFLLQLYYKHL